jgi:hypothetical protein
MKVKDLSSETLQKIKVYRYDRFVEKHEGPFDWEGVLKYYEPEFLEIENRLVSLPLDKSHHTNLTILRTIVDKEDKTLTIFLKDTTYTETPNEEFFMAGFVSICEKVPGEDFFIAILYHEWFILEEHIQ